MSYTQYEEGNDLWTNDPWDSIKEEYEKACSMPYRPSEHFRRVKPGEIIDEEKSVRWNKEEAERLNAEYNEEVKRLRHERYEKITEATKRAVRMISKESGLTVDKAEILWDFVYDKYHSDGEMFQHIDEYIDLINQITE